MPTITGNLARTVDPRVTTATRRARWTTICHGVTANDPASAGTQPVAPFGRVGSRIWSQRPPLGPVASRSTGSARCDPVNGVRAASELTARAAAEGAARATTRRPNSNSDCPRSAIAALWPSAFPACATAVVASDESGCRQERDAVGQETSTSHADDRA